MLVLCIILAGCSGEQRYTAIFEGESGLTWVEDEFFVTMEPQDGYTPGEYVKLTLTDEYGEYLEDDDPTLGQIGQLDPGDEISFEVTNFGDEGCTNKDLVYCLDIYDIQIEEKGKEVREEAQ